MIIPEFHLAQGEYRQQQLMQAAERHRRARLAVQHHDRRPMFGRRRRLAAIISALTTLAVLIGALSAADAATSAQTVPSAYVGVAPTALGSAITLAAGGHTNVTVAGIGVVPAAATSVQLSVSVTGGTAASAVHVSAAGDSTPTPAAVQFAPRQAQTATITARVGAKHQVTVTNDAGTVQVGLQLIGYYVPSPLPSAIVTYGPGHINFTAGAGFQRFDQVQLPTGTFLITATASFGTESTAHDGLSCELIPSKSVPQSGYLGIASIALEGDTDYASMTVTGVLNSADDSVGLYCLDGTGEAFAEYETIDAIQIGSLTVGTEPNVTK